MRRERPRQGARAARPRKRYAWQREERTLESKKREQKNQASSREFWWWLGAVPLVAFFKPTDLEEA